MLTILKASAGSGKTFQLTKFFIKLLLGRKVDDSDDPYRLRRTRGAASPDRHRAILAITFTNKATDEMKERIIHELAILAGMEVPDVDDSGRVKPKKSEYLGDLTRELHCTPDELRAEAASALHQLLFDFNFFNVSTIDSFFQLILRTFAYEAELEGDYEVDLDDESAIDAGIVNLFASLAEKPDTEATKKTVAWITEYLIDNSRKGKAVNLFNRTSKLYVSFIKRIARLNDENFAAKVDELTEYLGSTKLKLFRDALAKANAAVITEVAKRFTDAINSMTANPLPKGNFTADMVNAMKKFLASGDYADMMSKKTIPGVAAGNTNIATTPGMTCFADGRRADQYNLIFGACQYCLDNWPRFQLFNAILRNLFDIGMMNDIYRHMEMVRAENNTLLLSDTNQLLHRIMGDADAPFIFERVGLRLRHFLIDEFQDTSGLQWANIRPLIDNSQSYGHDNLIIGDEKQSIYRFRGSDPTLIGHTVPKEVLAPVSVDGNTPDENKNWRSTVDVVEFNNTLFHTIAAQHGFSSIYANVCQQIDPSRGNPRGYVDVRRFDCDKNADFVKQAHARLLEEMKRELSAGFLPKDITILTRGNAEAAEIVDFLLETFATDPDLKERKLRVVSDDAMLINSSPAVRRVVSTLRAIASPPTTNADPDRRYRSAEEMSNLLAHYERQIGLGKTPSEALRHAIDSANTPADDISDDDVAAGSRLRSESLSPLVELIIGRIGQQAEGEQLFLLAFEDLVAEFCEKGNADVQSFLRWWDLNGSKAKVSGAADDNAVRVMTIHKSKGLEFRCCHLVLAQSDMLKFHEAEWFEKEDIPGINPDLVPPLVAIIPSSKLRGTNFEPQFDKMVADALLDEINVLYVAFTRAIDELIVSYNYHKPKKPSADPALSIQNGQVILEAIEAMGGADGSYTAGEPVTKVKQKNKKSRAIDPRGQVELTPMPPIDRPDLWDFTSLLTNEEKTMGLQRGNMLHGILANIDNRRSIHKAIIRAVRSGQLPFASAADVERRLTDAIDADPHTRRWFAPGLKVLRERSVIPLEGRSSRPDRVVIYPDGSVEIIDYKFGKPKPGYKVQVRGYINLFRQMGYSPVRGYLWYVDAGQIREVK